MSATAISESGLVDNVQELALTQPRSTDWWGWTFARGFSTLVEPISRVTEFVFRCRSLTTPGVLDNYDTPWKEKAYRVMVGTALLTAMVGTGYLLYSIPAKYAIGALVGYPALLGALRVGAYACQAKQGYTYVQGAGKEAALPTELPDDKTFSLMTWNVCGIWGGICRSNGGVLEWRKRFDEIVNKIRFDKPDVLVLQEIYDTAFAEKLVEALKDVYPHFYTTMGPNVFGSVGGLFVATKFPVHQFSHTSFTNSDWTMNRGFATLDLGTKDDVFARVIGTHHIHGGEASEKLRRVQVEQILASAIRPDSTESKANAVAQTDFRELPTFYCGDLNQTPKVFEAVMGDRMYAGTLSEQPESTCTDDLIREAWNPQNQSPDERLDYIVQIKNTASKAELQVRTLEMIPLGEAGGITSRTALSDHRPVKAYITLR